jgi:hypothetical protein
LFIGNSTEKKLKDRVDGKIFPYGNVQILTEFTDNLKVINYTYKSNTDVVARLPIIITGSVASPIIAANTSIIINSIEVVFKETSTLSSIINTINNIESLNVRAFSTDNSHISLITTDTKLSLEEGTVYEEGIIKRLGFGTDSIYAQTASIMPERTLQEVLDDYCSVKNYGAYGNGTSDDSKAIYNAIISLNKAGNDSKYYRTLFFPAGTYISDSTILPLPYGTHLKGEGIGRTIIKANNILDVFFATMDSKFILSNSDNYGVKANTPEYITIEDMTLDTSECLLNTLMNLASASNVVFRNVEFISSQISSIIKFVAKNNASSFSNIEFENCVFSGGNYGIYSATNLEHLVVKNCLFKNIKNYAISLNPESDSKIINCIIDGNKFENCSANSNIIISLGNNTEYVSVINSKFDEDVSNGTSDIKPYNTKSELNYTDILDASTDTKKLLRFKFTQPIWDYIDYLVNPNGEYLVKGQYNTYLKYGEQIVPELTNGLIIEQGDATNNNTISIASSNPLNDINITSGAYGNVQIGKSLEQSAYASWELGNDYITGDKVQFENKNTIVIYECIKDNNNKVLSNNEYWKEIATYNPKVVFNTTIDLNGSTISDEVGNITLETNNAVVIEGDDYADRIGSNLNAIPNIDYIKRFANSSNTNDLSFEEIGLLSSNTKELIYFNPNNYGDVVNMDRISLNVRVPFYPMVKYINSDTPYWTAGYKYYKNNVVKQAYETNSLDVEIYTVVNGSWVLSNETLLYPDSSKFTSDGNLVNEYGDDGNYAIANDSYSDKHLYHKISGLWYEIGSEEWNSLYSSYAIGKADTTFTNGSIISINTTPISLSGTTVDDAVLSINNAFTDGSVVATNVEGALKIYQSSGVLRITDVNGNALETLGFEMNESTKQFKVIYPELFNIVSATPTINDTNSIWLKPDSSIGYFICIKDHIASNVFEDDLDVNTATSKWYEIYNSSTSVDTDEIIDIPDVKYVSIIAKKDNITKLLIKQDMVDLTKRNIYSVYENDWQANTLYEAGDRVLFKDRYYKCLQAHTSSTEADIHDSTLWTSVFEEGYNYQFDFERMIYTLNENDEYIADDVDGSKFNYSGYTLYLEFYDENCKVIPVFKYYDGSEMIEESQLNPNGVLTTTIHYNRG